MDRDSPFANHETARPITSHKIIYILFCEVCYYLWKAPGETTKCINCKGNGETVITLKAYEPQIPIL